ncbi:MAG: hypothetical protein R3F02_06190 [Thiolinea sp.]
MEIDHSTLQAELNRVLSSRCFRSRKRLCKFLSYIVEETLQGRRGGINQYSIAINAFGKAADFDAGDNPLVRVQAGRLRTRLQEYYDTEGRFNPIQIDVPSGSYCPVFERRKMLSPGSALTDGLREISQSQGPGIVCIPRSFAVDETVGWPFINRLTRDYVTALSRFNYCQVMLADAALQHRANWPEDAWLQYGADFALFFDLHTAEQGYGLKCSLVCSRNRQVVWAHSFSLSHDYSADAIRQVYKRIANDTAGVEKGLALTYWARQLLDSGKPVAPHHRVMVSMRRYCWDIGIDTFRIALRACEQRLEQYPDDVQALSLFADYCRGEYMMKYQQITPLYPHTAEAVGKLLQLAPENAYSHLFQAMLYLFTEDAAECETALERALAINSLDNHLNNLAGLAYMGIGEWEKGAALVQDCIDTSPLYPDWYHIGLCVSCYRTGHYLAAMREAKKIRLRHVWAPMLRAAIYQHANSTDKGRQEYERLKNEYPNFVQDADELTRSLPRSSGQLVRQLWTPLLQHSPENRHPVTDEN